MAAFEHNYEQIANTELWQLLVKRSEEQGLGRDFVTAVGKVCAIGLDLSKDIIRFFPNFTFHDGSHSAHVCDWMARLLGERTKDLTAHEAALLLMAACCHDIGMSVSDAQKQKLLNPAFSGWKRYFEAHLDDDEEFCSTGVISERMLRNYIRLHHHERIRENLRSSDWPRELSLSGLPWDALLVLCKSHGTSLSRSELKNTTNYDLLMCAVLLRLADLLDYDASRTSDSLFRHMGLDTPQTAEEAQSAHEHHKNRVGAFDPDIRDGVIRYRAVYDHPQMEHDIREYLNWIERELDHCAEILTQSDKRWQGLPLPYKISTDDAERNGYAAGKFCMTMDQDRVIELLTGKNLYSDPGVFVRELLQNSIDAVLMRAKQDPDFSLEEGRIIIDTWPGDAGDTWFRIRDNGTGMDEHIIQNYFLKVGRSYYTSDEFRAANRHAPGGKSYTAISRFGIGILSCFMTDPEGTELKVSTKRFRGSDDNGIRLDVTGLHGYYYLSHEAKHPDYEDSFLQMPSPDGENLGYREEPGTTICVRTNLFRLGGVQSFREILDKYVQFPEIRVEYNGPEGHKEYPTQQELMDAVYALNPDGEVREYVHEIPDAWFEEIKEVLSIVEWEQKPAVIIRYYPIDWLSDSETMTGVVVKIWLHCKAFVTKKYHQSIWNQEKISYIPESDFSISFADANRIVLNFGLKQSHTILVGMDDEVYQRMVKGVSFEIPIPGDDVIFSHQEQGLLTLFQNSLCFENGSRSQIAYSGILADCCAPLDEEPPWYSDAYTIMLLNGEFMPDVNLARSSVDRLALEASCCLTMVCDGASLSDQINLLEHESLVFATERDLQKIIDNHPYWKIRLLDSDNPTQIKLPRSLYERLCLVAQNGSHAVQFDFFNADYVNRMFTVTAIPSNEKTLDFPMGMFALPEKEHSPLAFFRWHSNIYNIEHTFSQWLIQNRAQLVELVPVVYDNLIQTMLFAHFPKTLSDTVNTILTRIRDFNGNCFGIYDGLFLTENDFV